ncbi:MAG: (2Fe-2S)-binding protein [Myxococcales bacterium]|nr:(2Fe-2S)-binding protein [Myxococcales bacterium]
MSDDKPAPPKPPGPPPPKNPGFVTCTIDGREVVVKPGTNMIDAARQAGSEIPYYCYHQRLSIAANCRMCLVEVSTAPKLVPACQTPLAEGMAVKTQSSKVKESQRAVMEFLLLNHPVDCAICDQAGECKLQDYYMRYDYRPSRLEGGKVLKEKRKVLGPLVVLDQERCIMCTRCVRFMEEVAKEPQLGMFGRGSHETIDVFPGGQLDSNYAGNTVDICPVGALLSRDFRFRARAWFLSSAPSVCTGCSRGCNTYLDFFGQDVYRYRPRENPEVNQSWMCDVGRLSYKVLNRGRLLMSRVGRGSSAPEATRSEAVKYAAMKLKPLFGEKLGVLASPLCSNEDLLAALSLAKEVFGAKAVFAGGRAEDKADHFLLTADRNPNRKGLQWIAAGLGLALRPFEELPRAIESGEVKALYAVGTELPSDEAAFAPLLSRLELLVVQAINDGPLRAQAHVSLAAASHAEDEGSFVQKDGAIQRFRRAFPPRGDAWPHWRWASELWRELAGAAIFHSSREVWQALSSRVPELASFDWDGRAPIAQLGRGLLPLAAAADGRPGGYREVGVPRVRGI